MSEAWSARGRRCACLGVLCVLLAAAAQAAYLSNVPQTLAQPDGKVLHLLATGDEYYNWLHDAAGYVVVRDPRTGFLVYAVKVDGRLQPSPFVVGETDPALVGLEKGVKPDPQYLRSAGELFPVGRRHLGVRPLEVTFAPQFSHINNLTIFIRFADEGSGFTDSSTYEKWFNSSNSKDSSMRRYFLEASYGQLTVDSTFYPTPSGTTVVSYQDSHPRAYYQPQSTTNPDGYTDSNRNQREHTLLKAAVDSVASQVPSTLDLDNDHDGYVDNVVFVVNGSPDAWASLLWPHRWALTAGYPVVAMINGKQVDDYNFQLDSALKVGVLCHEMTHTLGAPDLYHYDTCSSAPGLDPVWSWDLMAHDTDPPQHTTAYLKFRYMGWISEIPLISTSGTYTLQPLTSSTNNCYKIASPNSTSEYFVVEYRKRSFPFENMVPGDGLIVYRIRDAVRGNSCGPPDEVYVYRPGGTPTLQGNVNNAFFSSATLPAARTAINDSTDPSPFLSNGYPGGLSISGIGAPGDTISFTVTIQEPCSKPGTFSLTSPTRNATVPAGGPVTLSWTASAGAASYDVYFGTAQSPPLLGNQTATSINVSVTDGSSYFWRVVAKNTCGEALAPASGTWGFSAGGSGGLLLLSDDFEGDLSKWRLGRTAGASATSWGVVTCKSASGNGAAWCAAGGAGAQTPCTQYAPGQGTFMIAGPFSLADATDGTWDFDLWTDIDDGGNPNDPPDVVYWMWSLNGTNYYGYGASGATNGWEHVTVKFSEMTMSDGTPVIGQAKVYFAFLFLSDGTTQKEGAYIDNVAIRESFAPLGPKPRKHLPAR